MEAWKIESSYDMTLTAGLGPGIDASTLEGLGLSWFTNDYPGIAEYYWVEGMGLVYEKHVNTNDDTVILEKTLTNVAGL